MVNSAASQAAPAISRGPSPMGAVGRGQEATKSRAMTAKMTSALARWTATDHGLLASKTVMPPSLAWIAKSRVKSTAQLTSSGRCWRCQSARPRTTRTSGPTTKPAIARCTHSSMTWK